MPKCSLFRYVLTSISAFILLTGCGSITHHERHQFVLVRSKPPGADIYYHGERVGTTPSFVEVRRLQEDSLQLMDDHTLKNLPLTSRYRWDGSFWTNFVFLYFAPIGWGVDLLTGAAWNMNDPEILTLQKPTGTLTPRRTVVAIAPPEAYSANISDEGGMVWQRYLTSRYQDLQILPYREKVDEFSRNGYDFDSKPGFQAEHELFGRLQVRDIFESQFKDTHDGIELIGRFRNVYSGETGPIEMIKAAPTEEEQSWAEKFKNYIHLIPNTVGYEISRSDVELSDAHGTYQSRATYDETVWSQVAPFLASVNFTSQVLPRRESAGHWHFEFVPTLLLSYRRLEFPTLTTVQGNEFSYFNMSAGLGPEIGRQWGPNYLYLNFIPIYGWHRLAWISTDDSLKVSSIGEFTFRSELGYLYYLTDRFSVRLYVKSTSSPARLWNSAIQDLAPGAPQLSSVTDVNLGLLFGYNWEPRRDISKWKIFN